MTKAKAVQSGATMSLPAVLAFACASIPIAAFQLAVTVHLPRYFATHLGLALAVVGGAFALIRLVDIPIDAVTGLAMDRTKTRFGRYRIWLLAGAPVFMLGLYMMMRSGEGVGFGYLFGWLLVMYLGYSSFYLGHLAWAGSIAPTYKQRSRIFADLFLILGPGASAPIYVFFFHGVKLFDAASVGILLIPYTASGIFGAPFWGRVAQKLGKHRTVQIAGLAYAVTQAALMAIPAGLFWPTFISMFTVGFCGSAFVVLIRAMVADVADELRLETGQERSGVLYAIVTLTQKLGSSLAVVIIYPILDMVGFNPKPGAHNTAEALQGLSMSYVFAPIILVTVGSLCLIGYKLSAERQSEIRKALEELEARDFAAGAEVLGGPGENVAARAS